MSWRTSSTILSLRNLGRIIGLNRLLASARRRGYEDRFQTAMMLAIRAGDTVWDVGANQGLYSEKFAERVGGSGRVFAIEPSPKNLLHLQKVTESLSNVIVAPVALGDTERVARFQQGKDALGATSRVLETGTPNLEGSGEVAMFTGDELISSGRIGSPDVIKIDTEGCELDVLRGLKQTLASSSLRVLGIEVHFAQLRERGRANDARKIESMLQAAQFSVAWKDASHIVAIRTTW